MKVVVKCFWVFLIESDMLVNFEDLLIEDLNKLLKIFYVGVRKNWGIFLE